MIRFPFIEKYGVTAIMSDVSGGDCCTRADAQAFLEKQGVPEPDSLAIVSQVHGTCLIDSNDIDSRPSVEADGIVSDTSGALMAVRIADCVPVFLYDPVRMAGAIVHAGREGTHRKITQKAVILLNSRFQVNPSDLIAIIGPSAGACCYEVNSEMASDFEENGGVRTENHLDLWETNRNQLQKNGVKTKNIEISGICTICSGNFHSYRKTGTKFRNVAVLRLPNIAG